MDDRTENYCDEEDNLLICNGPFLFAVFKKVRTICELGFNI